LNELEQPELGALDQNKHVSNQIAGVLTQRIYQLQVDGKMSAYQLMTINEQVQSFTDICGACERIKNTPIPFSYSLFIKKFIFFYVMSLPIAYVFSLGYYVCL